MAHACFKSLNKSQKRRTEVGVAKDVGTLVEDQYYLLRDMTANVSVTNVICVEIL